MTKDRAHEAEALRRRDRVQQGRSPGQHTTRSRNQARATKRPGKGTRSNQQRKAIAA